MGSGGRGNDDFARLVDRQVARYGDKPLVTWYDDDRGERVELSFRTFENWVAKTANLLVEELGVEPGERVATLLPAHWQTLVVLAGCWRAGVSVVPAAPAAAPLEEAGCRVAFVREEWLDEVPARFAGRRPTVVALSAELLGGGDLGGALSFARTVPGMGDLFDGEGAAPDAEALLVGEGGAARAWSQAELLAAAGTLAQRLGLGDADRLYSGHPADGLDGTITGLVLPLLAGAGVVLEGPFRPATLWKRLAQERVTVALLTSDQAAALSEAGPADDGIDLSRLRRLAVDTVAGTVSRQPG